MLQPPAVGWVSGCVCWMLQSMVQREENTITNEIMVRAWPNSMQSAHFARGECLAACAVSQHGEVPSEPGENGRWMRWKRQRQPRCCAQAGTGLCGVFAKGPARHCSGEGCESPGVRAGAGRSQPASTWQLHLLLPALPGRGLEGGQKGAHARGAAPEHKEGSSGCCRKDSSRIAQQRIKASK